METEIGALARRQPEHVMTLFDSEASRATAVAAFIAESYQRREPVAVLATGRHWEAIVAAAGAHAAELSRGLADGASHFCDAEMALHDISRGGYPDRALFDRFLAGLLARVPAGRVNVYGELVDVLASRGEFSAAIELEHFWNAGLEVQQIHLMCGYDATHFASYGAASRLRDLCACHSATRVSADDALGRWLLGQADVPVSGLARS